MARAAGCSHCDNVAWLIDAVLAYFGHEFSIYCDVCLVCTLSQVSEICWCRLKHRSVDVRQILTLRFTPNTLFLCVICTMCVITLFDACGKHYSWIILFIFIVVDISCIVLCKKSSKLNNKNIYPWYCIRSNVARSVRWDWDETQIAVTMAPCH